MDQDKLNVVCRTTMAIRLPPRTTLPAELTAFQGDDSDSASCPHFGPPGLVQGASLSSEIFVSVVAFRFSRTRVDEAPRASVEFDTAFSRGSARQERENFRTISIGGGFV